MAGSGSLRLKLRDPDGQEREVSFTQDVITIGRSHECDLPLESGFISRNHARMSHISGGWQIVDEGSKNGVFVNGQRIAGSTAVKPGDALRIGDYRVSVLPVETVAAATVDEADKDRTLVINPAMLEDLDLPAGQPRGGEGESAAPSSTITAPETRAEQRPQEQPPEQPATPPYGVAAAEPAVAVETVAATDAPAGSSETPAAGVTPRLIVDAANRSVVVDGRNLTGQLAGREIDLLVALSAAGVNGSGIEELANAVWGSGGGDTEMLERLLSRLRGKLNADLIDRLPGGGLRLRGKLNADLIDRLPGGGLRLRETV